MLYPNRRCPRISWMFGGHIQFYSFNYQVHTYFLSNQTLPPCSLFDQLIQQAAKYHQEYLRLPTIILLDKEVSSLPPTEEYQHLIDEALVKE